jgi:hypothetical protein
VIVDGRSDLLIELDDAERVDGDANPLAARAPLATLRITGE